MGGRYRIELDHESVHAGDEISGRVIVEKSFDSRLLTITLWSGNANAKIVHQGPRVEIELPGPMSPGDSFGFGLRSPVTAVPTFADDNCLHRWSVVGHVTGPWIQGMVMTSVDIHAPSHEVAISDRLSDSQRSEHRLAWTKRQGSRRNFLTSLLWFVGFWAIAGSSLVTSVGRVEDVVAGREPLSLPLAGIVLVAMFVFIVGLRGVLRNTRPRVLGGVAISVERSVVETASVVEVQVLNPESVPCAVGLRCVKWYRVEYDESSRLKSRVIHEEWRSADSSSVVRFNIPDGPPSFVMGGESLQWEIRLAGGATERRRMHSGLAEHLVVLSRASAREQALPSRQHEYLEGST